MIASSSVFHGRIVMIGNAAVGKTSILNQLMDHSFNEIEPTTVGANYQLYSTEIDGTRVEIQIWDTAGQEKFRALAPIYFRNAAGTICVYDATNKDSYESISDWITSFTDVAGTETLIAVVGNKCDLKNSLQVTKEEADQWAAEQGYLSFATSAKTGEGVEEMFKEIAKELIMVKTASFDQPTPVQAKPGCC